MARPRRGKRRRKRSDWLTNFLITGIEPDKNDPKINPFEVISLVYNTEKLLPEWESRRTVIMGSWNKPGIRPYAWWLYDAPRLPMGTFPGVFFDGKFPEPRLHLSGPGRPVHEVLGIVPSQDFGIYSWYGDPDNPPTFETQFEYLKRHGLLLPGEDEPLPEHQTQPEAITDAAHWEYIRSLCSDRRN